MAIPAQIQLRLAANAINNGMPAWTIIDNARLLPPAPVAALPFGDQPAAAMTKLMTSFYNFGRTRWTWTQSSPPTAANGGLVKGLTNNCACGSFNLNFKWLAETLCGINGITQGQDTGQFLTVPGGVCIDSKWPGNVCSDKAFAQLKVFKFHGHWWVVYGGVNYDTCFNNTFHAIQDIIWTKLLQADARLLAECHLPNNQLFKLEKPLPNADHLVQTQQFGPNNWPSWQLVNRQQLKLLRR